MRRPSFFIVGAPKCGTSALASYLRAHPAVFMSWPKEPLFFCKDFDGVRTVDTLAEYERLFESRPPEATAVGEASAMYLYSEIALTEIKKFNPDARIVAMIRNPVELVQSFHSQMLFALSEDESDFETAWRLQAKRRDGQRIPARCAAPEFLQYRDVAMLGTQITRLYELFPRDQILVLRNEDLARIAAASIRKSSRFSDCKTTAGRRSNG